MKRTRAYLLPEVLCPTEKLDICISIPNDLGHIMPFLAQLEALANWYTWERNEAHDNDIVAACWREIFDDVRNKIDNQLGCGVTGMIQDVRMVDCLIEKQDEFGVWTTVGSVAECVASGIDAALADGTIPASPYPQFPPPETNDTNPTVDEISCGIASFIAEYVIEKYHDQLDVIETATGLGLTTAKITLDVLDAVIGWAPVVGGAIAAIKDTVEGSVNAGFALIRASDTVEWRSDVKCSLYDHLKANNGLIGGSLAPVITPWIADIKNMSPLISPLLGRFLEAIDLKAFQKWAKISEDNEGECDDCQEVWCYTFDFTAGTHSFGVVALGQEGYYGTWQNGVGFIGGAVSAGRQMPANATLTRFKIERNAPNRGTGFYITDDDSFPANEPQHYLESEYRTTEPPIDVTLDPPFELTTAHWISIGTTWYNDENHVITRLTLWGTGANPFGEDNCT